MKRDARLVDARRRVLAFRRRGQGENVKRDVAQVRRLILFERLVMLLPQSLGQRTQSFVAGHPFCSVCFPSVSLTLRTAYRIICESTHAKKERKTWTSPFQPHLLSQMMGMQDPNLLPPPVASLQAELELFGDMRRASLLVSQRNFLW